jgi:hypothetical protein
LQRQNTVAFLPSRPAEEQPLGMFPRALHRANAPVSVYADPTLRSRTSPPTTPCCPLARTCCRRRATWLALRPRPRCSTPTSRGKQPAAAVAACARRPRENSLEPGRVAIAGARYTRRAGVSGRRERTNVIGRWGRQSHFSTETRGHGHAGWLACYPDTQINKIDATLRNGSLNYQNQLKIRARGSGAGMHFREFCIACHRRHVAR